MPGVGHVAPYLLQIGGSGVLLLVRVALIGAHPIRATSERLCDYEVKEKMFVFRVGPFADI